MFDVPTPQENESKDEYIARCIESLLASDPTMDKAEASAIAYENWSNSKNAKSLLTELTDRFDKIRSYLVGALGKRGEILLDYTLERIGAFDPKLKKFNLAMLDGTMNLPFIKSEDDGSIVIGNLWSPAQEFTKVDVETETVEGYANTVAIDTYADVFMPEAYKDSFEKEYLGSKKSPIYFMHHMDVDAGELVDMKFDDVGMYVKTKPYPAYWQLIKEGKLKGFSIGFYFKLLPDVVGSAYVTYKKFSIYGNDISYVTNPANLLSYFTTTPEQDESVKSRTDNILNGKLGQLKPRKVSTAIKTEQSQKMTDGNDLNVANKNHKKETQKMSEQDNKTQNVEVLSPEQLMKLSPDELMQYAEKQAERKFKLELASKIVNTEKTIAEAKQEDKYKDLVTKMAKFSATVDEILGKIATISAKLAIHDEKMIKMENEPSDVATNIHPTAPVNLMDAARNSMGFSAFREKAKTIGVEQ